MAWGSILAPSAMVASSPYGDSDEVVTSGIKVNRLRNINTRPGDAQALSLLATDAAIAIVEGVYYHTTKLSGSNNIVVQEDIHLGVSGLLIYFDARLQMALQENRTCDLR